MVLDYPNHELVHTTSLAFLASPVHTFAVAPLASSNAPHDSVCRVADLAAPSRLDLACSNHARSPRDGLGDWFHYMVARSVGISLLHMEGVISYDINTAHDHPDTLHTREPMECF